ncbi:hypothetical protein ACFQQB_41675 [Nonomuraea rubra]|uniref:hypothetical protein n=1 Tax=Nonomuraea rubra TaxID=46180 RepID=UPI0036143EF0
MPQQPASSSVTSAPGILDSSARVAAVPVTAFSWQWPCRRIRRPRSASPSTSEPSSMASDSSSGTSLARAATAATRGSPGSSAAYSSLSVSRQDGSRPTIGASEPDRRATRSSAIARARSSRPLEMLERPQQPSAARRTR